MKKTKTLSPWKTACFCYIALVFMFYDNSFIIHLHPFIYKRYIKEKKKNF